MKPERAIKIDNTAYRMSEVMKLIKTMNPDISIDSSANFVADIWMGNNALKDVHSLDALWKNYQNKIIIKGSYHVLCDIEQAEKQTDLKTQPYYKNLQHTALIQAALKNKGFSPRVYSIYRYLDLWETLFQFNKEGLLMANIEMIKKAHGDGSYTTQDIVLNQKKYQNWLWETFNGDEKVIMSCHRSVGFEYEFATYNLIEMEGEKSLPVHTVIGQTKGYSKLFKIPFTLETDTHNELELGFPPFLFVNYNTKINKQSIGNTWRLFKQTMHQVYLESKGDFVSGLINRLQHYQLGHQWYMSHVSKTLKIGKRKKHWEKEAQVYTQVNLSLTVREIAVYIENYGMSSYKSERYEYFDETYRQLYAAFKPFVKTLEGRVAMVHLCKGISGLLAIPSLLLLKENPEHLQNNRGVYSSVKEVYGVWVKDSIPNLVDASLRSKVSRDEMKQAIKNLTAQIETIMERQIQKAFEIIQNIPGAIPEQKKAAILEYKNTVKAIHDRLKTDHPLLLKHKEETIYKAETFPSKGAGVRKETFISLVAPEDKYFHLAEFRNDRAFELFLNI